ncbi:MAG: hypothetical protein IT317_13650 [Anaerolineales bacterium]|nr:hypothetical protein [Anaerolineales bacterium]
MHQPRRSGLIEPGEDPLQLVRQARQRRGLGGLFAGGLSLGTLFYVAMGLIFAYYLWWQFGPKPPVAAAQGPATASPTPTATATPSASPTSSAPASSASATPTASGTAPAGPTPFPTLRQEVTRLVPATVMVEVTRLVSAGGGSTRTEVQTVPVEVTRLVPATVEVVITAEPEDTEPPVVVVVTVVTSPTPTPSPTLEQPTPDPRLTELTWLPLILR